MLGILKKFTNKPEALTQASQVLLLLVTLVCSQLISAKEISKLKQSATASDTIQLLNKTKTQSNLPILVFYYGAKNNTNNFLPVLKNQLENYMPDRYFQYVDLVNKSRRQIEAELSGSEDCVMSIGELATQKMLSARQSHNYFVVDVSRNLLDRLRAIYKNLGISLTGIYQEQSLKRQIMLARALEPKLSTAGLLYNQKDKYRLNEHQNLSEQLDIELKFKILTGADSANNYLLNVSADKGFFLLSNNSNLYKSTRLAALVMEAYYRQVKLIGNTFESSQTGALASIYSPPTGLAIESAQSFKKMCLNKQVNRPEYAKSFSVSINQQVARNLYLKKLDKRKIISAITAAEKAEK